MDGDWRSVVTVYFSRIVPLVIRCGATPAKNDFCSVRQLQFWRSLQVYFPEVLGQVGVIAIPDCVIFSFIGNIVCSILKFDLNR